MTGYPGDKDQGHRPYEQKEVSIKGKPFCTPYSPLWTDADAVGGMVSN